MREESGTDFPDVRRRMSRTGKTARLPRAMRDELNQRLLDGESGAGLVKWLNVLPEVKAALMREFGGRPITKHNLSEWRQGGFRDCVAKTEADELLAHTLAVDLGSKSEAGSRRRKRSREKAVEIESVSDRVARWFFPHYVAAARGQLAAAQTPAGRWSVLRTICADLAGLRRSDHYMERLRIWQKKLRLETQVVTAEVNELKEKEVVEWVKAHPEIEQKIWPKRKRLTPEEKQRRIRQAFGLGWSEEVEDSSAKIEAPALGGGGEPEKAENG